MPEKILMSAEEVRRALMRIAHEITERNKGAADLVFVGIRTRGVPLAYRIASIVQSLEDTIVPVGILDIGPYRDDVAHDDLTPSVQSSEIPTDVADKVVVVVDDVLYTGRSIRAAMDALIDHGRPRSIQLAVLVDRGHREMPIRADYVGKNVPSARSEHIEVRLKEVDGRDEVAILDVSDRLSPASDTSSGRGNDRR